MELVPTTPACTWWNRPEEDNSSGKLESTHPSRTSVKSDQGFFGVESVMRVNADSLLIRAAATSTSGTLNDLTTDLIMANNNSGGAVTADSSCCANCVVPPRPQQWGPDLPLFGNAGHTDTLDGWRCCSQKRVMSRPIQVRQL